LLFGKTYTPVDLTPDVNNLSTRLRDRRLSGEPMTKQWFGRIHAQSTVTVSWSILYYISSTTTIQAISSQCPGSLLWCIVVPGRSV
jgi:hypothetical protein